MHLLFREKGKRPEGKKILGRLQKEFGQVDLVADVDHSLATFAIADFPVEYKKGSDKTQDADEVQLCAQALCLEEMLCCAIPEGSLFYGESRRRTRVALDESLRARTLSLLAELLENQARGHTPSVRAHKGCNACSLKDVCVPRLSRTGSVRAYMHARIAEDSP